MYDNINYEMNKRSTDDTVTQPETFELWWRLGGSCNIKLQMKKDN